MGEVSRQEGNEPGGGGPTSAWLAGMNRDFADIAGGLARGGGAALAAGSPARWGLGAQGLVAGLR